jgi:hypothetical protein|tara:strand:+ start:38 stop:223 length:186 start_codon:yes stop_codon:yes gene_type:complete
MWIGLTSKNLAGALDKASWLQPGIWIGLTSKNLSGALEKGLHALDRHRLALALENLPIIFK